MLVDVYFDGGCIPNPGNGYGSFEIISYNPLIDNKQSKIQFGPNLTNNRAEYLSLVAALKNLKSNLNIPKLKDIQLNIFTDSKLVVMQVSKKWGCKDNEIKKLLKQTKELLYLFGRFNVQWIPRNKIETRFGH